MQLHIRALQLHRTWQAMTCNKLNNMPLMPIGCIDGWIESEMTQAINDSCVQRAIIGGVDVQEGNQNEIYSDELLRQPDG